MEPLCTTREFEEDLTAAERAIVAGRKLRIRLRRRTRMRDPERQKEIDAQITSLEGHGSVLRSHLKRSDHYAPPFSPYSAAVRRRIKRLLREARYERRQLNKMLP